MHGHSTQAYISQFEESFKLKGFKGILRYGVFAISNSYCYDFKNTCSPNNLFKNYVWDLRFIYICKRYYILLHFLSQMVDIYSTNLLRDQSGCYPYDKEYEV